ncbi:MAG: thiamine-monophosphate kinase [Candidatus Mesenet longicola]|uniref:Thiamine-monophosphate kinase n=1 Tax=Candidatus Mesenet longicola TaxID=1892558 RepID=A0A8J3MNN7_9RICK|nr:MAG: thiamine-monophosphate kinase [Candidatus Mesenet longicola]GHM59148.1 MAG: thiamine-monophosphate kinase [Candidatus Mesenet longicola]
MREFEYIKRYLKPLDNSIGDDAATLANSSYLVTKDILIEGVHFFSNYLPYNLAKKSLRTNFSDIAAVGGTPYGYMLGLVLPNNVDDLWWESFVAGLKEDNKYFQVKLLGGDTTAHNGKVIISVTAFGIKGDRFIYRSGAGLGDLVCVSGTIGDAALGLLAYQGIIRDSTGRLKGRYDIPEPRVTLGQAISDFASSCIDISDGLIQDAQHICELSNVGMELHSDKIPLSFAAREIVEKKPDYIDLVLTGGDDYELLFTASSEHSNKIEEISQKCRVNITKIGHVTDGKEVIVRDKDNLPITLKNKGFVHFI